MSRKDLLVEVQTEARIKRFQMIDNNLLLLDLDVIENNILSSLSLVSHATIIKKFPSTINILIGERVGVAILCNLPNKDVPEECFVVDSQGVFFEKFSEENQLLPRIKKSNLQEGLVLGGQIIEKELLSILLDFYLNLKDLGIQLQEFLIVADNRINVETKEGWEIYFNPKENIEWQLTKLSAVLSEGISLEERGELEYIELRFGNTAPFKKKD